MKTPGGLLVLERVLKAISRYNMLGPSSRVIAAVSGGADSVCLAHVLRELSGQASHELALSPTLTHGDGNVTRSQATRSPAPRLAGIAHFNHKLRGEASEEDERFVAALARELGVPFYRDEARVVDGSGGNLEQNARQARRGFFASLIKEGKGDRVALGHTRDDQAETVLFRMLRGSGLAGLAGIHPVTADGIIRPLILIRPMLDVTRREVEEYLRERGIPWREDQSNCDLRFARNRIRHHLLPQLAREWNPRIAASLAQLADLAFEEESWWSANLENVSPADVSAGDKIACPTCSASEFRVEWLRELPRAVARRVIRRAIAKAKGDLRGIEFGHVEGVIDQLDQLDGLGGVAGNGFARRRVSGGVPGVEVLGSFGFLRIAPLAAARAAIHPVTVNIPGTYAISEGEIRLQIGTLGSTRKGPGSTRRSRIDETAESACANLKAELAAPLFLRGWKPGDHYRPVGKSRDHKLKEMFQNARIPSWRRRTWPILESGGKILWAREFGPAEEFAATGRRGRVLRVWDLRNAAN